VPFASALPRPVAALSAASIASLLFAAAVSGTSQPPADPHDERLLAHLEENATLHRQLAEHGKALHDAARISLNDLTLLQIDVCEAELLVATVRKDDRARAELLDEIVTLRERILSGLGPDAPPEAVADASQNLAQARVRRWELEHKEE